jgi:hypothetical protein
MIYFTEIHDKTTFILISDSIILSDEYQLGIMEVDCDYSKFLYNKSVEGIDDVKFYAMKDGDTVFGVTSFSKQYSAVRAFYISEKYRDRLHVGAMFDFLDNEMPEGFLIGCTTKNDRFMRFAEKNNFEEAYSDENNILYLCQQED